MKSTNPTNPETAVRILKAETCSSLSGKSKLKYQIGCNEASEILFRICGNDGGGFFNDDWVAFKEIQGAFAKTPNGKPITSFLLTGIFRRASTNSPGFLFAALVGEGLVIPSKEKARNYERADAGKFMAEVKALIASKVDLKNKHGNAKAEDVTVKKAPEQAVKKPQDQAAKKAQEQAVKKAPEQAVKKTQEPSAKKPKKAVTKPSIPAKKSATKPSNKKKS